MIARLKLHAGPPNSQREETEGKLQILISPRKNSVDSLFKEVKVFTVFLMYHAGVNFACTNCPEYVMHIFLPKVV